MPWAAAAAVAAAGIGAYSSHKASSAQTDASNAANDVSNSQYNQTRSDQLNQYNQQRTDQAPFLQAGQNAIGQLAQRTGNGGDLSQNYQRTGFETDPGYAFRQSEGLKGINSQAGAHGGLYSGATLKALSRFNSGLASQEYANYDQRQNNAYNQFNTNRDYARNNLASLAGVGQTASGAIGQAGQNAYGTIAQAGNNNANLMSQNLQNAGEARASGYVGAANNIGSGIRQYYNNQQQNTALNGLGGYGKGGTSMGYTVPDTSAAYDANGYQSWVNQ